MDDEKLKSQIGANIAAYRKQAGLTQVGLAEKLEEIYCVYVPLEQRQEIDERLAALIREEEEAAEKKAAEKAAKEKEKAANAKAKTKSKSTSKKKTSAFEKAVNSTANTIGREVGKKLVRGFFNTLLK